MIGVKPMATDFSMHAGDDKVLTVTVKDPDDAAVNLSSATIKWQAAKSFGKASAISKATSSGIEITDTAGGVFEITLDAADTESLRGTFQHEAEVTFSDGTISTVMSGTMRVKPVVIEAT